MATLKAIEDIATVHAEEVAFLWILRDGAVHAPHYELDDLVKLDARIEAHLDGLRVAGPAAWEVCRQELNWQEAGEVFLASVLAFESGPGASARIGPGPGVGPPLNPGAGVSPGAGGDAQRVEEVLGVVGTSQELARGVISALGWLTYSQAEPHIRTLLESQQPEHRCIGIAASAVHRMEPGQALTDALDADEPTLRARALRVVGELGRRDLASKIVPTLKDDDDAVRFWSAWSLTLMGQPSAIDILCQFAEDGDRPHARRAGELAARRMPPAQALNWQRRLSDQQPQVRLAMVIAAAIGDPVLIPWLLDLMKIQEHARLAGEAFTMITGLDLELHKLDTDAPEGHEIGPNDDPDDENVDLDPDEDLPWPAVSLIEKWWSQNSAHFPAGVRHLMGKPIDEESVLATLREAKQRQRTAAAIERVQLRPGTLLFETRQRGDRQVAALTNIHRD